MNTKYLLISLFIFEILSHFVIFRENAQEWMHNLAFSA